MMRLFLGVVVLSAGCLCSCSQSVAPPPERSTPDQTNLLAMLDPEGNSTVDRQVRNFQARSRKAPGSPEAWVELGRAWVRKARSEGNPLYYRSADACAEKALRLAPRDARALDLRGLVLLNDHRFEDARRLAQELIHQQPDDAAAWGTLADALLELGDYRGAEAAAQQMLHLKPNLPSYSRASYLLWLEGDAERAKELARLSIDAGRDQRDPEPLAWVTVQAAMLFWQEGDYDGAEVGFDRALALKPGFSPALVGKARVALSRGRAASAVELLEDAFARTALAETAGLLADARRLAGDAAGAAAMEREVMRLGQEGDRRSLSLYLSAHDQDADRALSLAELESKVRQDIYTQDALAWALYRKGRFAEARVAIDRALVLETPDARLLYHAGMIRRAAGESQTGLALVKKALSLNPGFDPAGSAEARRFLALR